MVVFHVCGGASNGLAAEAWRTARGSREKVSDVTNG
jgi:hypothetical protein